MSITLVYSCAMIRYLPEILTPSRLITISLLLYMSPQILTAATLYKWIDDEGKVRYSDRIPTSDIKKQHQTLNKQGVVINTKEAAKTEEELAAEAEAKINLEIQLAEEKRIKGLQDKKDRVLLLTFSSEEEMIAVRENRISVIDSVIRLIEKSIADNEVTLIGLQDSADSQYVSKGQEIPGGLAQKIEHFTRKIASRTEQLNSRKAEKNKVKEQFDLDLARYRLLKEQAKN